MENGLETLIRTEADRLGFDMVGIAPVLPSEHAAYYEAWLAAGHHGEMSYLSREDAVERRVRPQDAWPTLRSAVVVALNYYVDGDSGADRSTGVIARYARGRDYHKVMKSKLLRLLEFIEQQVGRELPAARAYVDTGPVLERELARRAGLGWFGRNAMLVHPQRGSYFFLGTLLLELELGADAPFEAERCGTCSACVSACPTGALLGRNDAGAPMIDARRCISYLTIENRGAIPHELRPLVGNRIFGCDICQEVCPWNAPKFVTLTRERDFSERTGMDGRKLIELMSMDEARWDEFSRGSPIRRAKRAGFLRNVAVALGNWGSPEAVPVLVDALADDEPLVRAHAAWALGRIASADALHALKRALDSETDAAVRAELHHVMTQMQPRVFARRRSI
jgi:epoxyqueuosine reductase